jgi:hypothetical protein
MLKYLKEKTSKTQVYMHKKLKIVLSSSFIKVYSELGGFFNFRYNISFIAPPLGGFVEILPSVMIFSLGQSPSENIIITQSGNTSAESPSLRVYKW